MIVTEKSSISFFMISFACDLIMAWTRAIVIKVVKSEKSLLSECFENRVDRIMNQMWNMRQIEEPRWKSKFVWSEKQDDL